jgi:hypothetical protein
MSKDSHFSKHVIRLLDTFTDQDDPSLVLAQFAEKYNLDESEKQKVLNKLIEKQEQLIL